MGLFNMISKIIGSSTESVLQNNENFNKNSSQLNNQNECIIPIEERIKGKEPTCDGLYPHEVLVLNIAESYFTNKKNSFAGYWWYKYGVSDVQGILNSLEKRGYITVGSIRDAILKSKVADIKVSLKQRNLKVTGKKEILINRLVANVPEKELDNEFSQRPYKKTELGEQILKKYEWIPFIHRHNCQDLDIWNLTELVQQPPYLPYRDKIWGYLNEKSIEHFANKDFGLYRNTKFEMSEFVAQEGKYSIAFDVLCEVVAFDLNGADNGFEMDCLFIYYEYYFPYQNSLNTLPPGVIDRIKEYSNILGWNELELKEHLMNRFLKIHVPLRLFTNEECVEIVIAELDKNIEKLEQIYNKASIRFKQTYKDYIKQ